MNILIFLLLSLWFIYIYIAKKRIKKNIKESSSVEESISHRKKYKKWRKNIIIITTIIAIVIAITYNYIYKIESTFDFIRHICMSLFGAFISYEYLKSNFKVDNMSGNISSYTKDSYLQSVNQYILYLRGFSTDQRHHAIPSKMVFKKFHELEFMTLLQKQFEVCTVGLPEEIEAPHGATRIYLNHQTWKNDVAQLIEKALHIYILVNNSQSCVWEIIESRKYLTKTTLIVDNIVLYNSVREILNKKIPLPQFNLPNKKIARITFQEGLPCVNFYKNSVNGYSDLLNIERKGIKTYLNYVAFIIKRAMIYSFVGAILAFIIYFISPSFFDSSSSVQYCILALPTDSTSVVYKSGIRDTCVLIKYNNWTLNNSIDLSDEFIKKQRNSVKNIIVYDIHECRYIYKTFSERIIGLYMFDGIVNDTLMDKIINDINSGNIKLGLDK